MSVEKHLEQLLSAMRKSGNPDRDFFYLAGAMTGYHQQNFPRFKEVAEILRNNGYNIISPAEIDDTEVEAAVLAGVYDSKHYGPQYTEFLGRDFIICSLPTCVGGIFIDGWKDSRGATEELRILKGLDKQTLEFRDDEMGMFGLPCLCAMLDDTSKYEITSMSNAGDIVIQEKGDYAISN